ncbi:MAG: anthranilate synthase component I, partial [Gammaproteobacteria bacterium]|nr:anthranilate synthase component I [Gammaproteobacteria bacterium]
FGFDLVFQFETLERRHARDPEQVDCCLFFPTELVVVDRRREEAVRLRYDFETPAGPSRQGGQEPAALPEPVRAMPGGMDCDHGPGEFEAKVER